MNFIKNFMSRHRGKKQLIQSQSIEATLKNSDDDAIANALSPFVGALLSLGDIRLSIIWAVFSGANELAKHIQNSEDKEFLEFLKAGRFTDAEMQTAGFREGLIRTYTFYSQERDKEKRNMIKKIFAGFVKTIDRNKFRIERIYRVLDSLEPDDFVALKRINEIVIPYIMESREKDWQQGSKENRFDGKSLEQYLIDQEVKGWEFSQEVANKIGTGLVEGFQNLEANGIIIIDRPMGAVLGPVSPKYRLSPFGYEFLKYLIK